MRKTIILILLATLLIAALLPAPALAVESEKTVRVGWFPYPGNSEVHDGRYSGYTYDYLMEIAKYTGWKYEFVETDFASCAEMLKNGEIDIVGGLQKTDDRDLIYDYPEIPYGQTYTVMFTKQDSPLQQYDFTNYNGIRIGILKDTANDKSIAEFADDNSFTYTLSEYATSEELHEALNVGSIDAAVLISYVPKEDTRVIAKFAPMSIYIVTTKGNIDVLSGLNSALNLIKINRLYFEEELYQKYYVAAESLELTEQEHALVQCSLNTPVTVGVIANCAPISYWNAEKGTCEGLTVEIFDTVCKKTGLHVQYIPVDMSTVVQNRSTGSLPQLVLGVPLVDMVVNDENCYLSAALMEDPLAIVGKVGTDLSWSNGKTTVALVSDFSISRAYIEDRLPDSEIVEYSTLEECMTAVAEGKADATVYFQSCIIYFLQKPYFSDLMLVPADTAAIGMCVAGFSEDSQPLLRIVDKGISRISDNELRALTLNTTMLNTYPMTTGDMLYEYRIPLVVIALLIAAIIAVLIVLYSVKRKSAQKLNIAYQQKNEALIEARQASAAKGNFMSRMSHEIRTPLNAVIGYNTIAQNEMTEAKTDEERRQSEMKVMDCLTKSGIASKHLLTIINDVLDMSAIESGKIKVVNERFDFKGLISSLTAVFYSQAKSKGVDFTVQFDTQMDEWVIGDQMRVNQILTNLLGNAVKFTPDGGKVTLFIHPVTEQSSIHLRFEVRDTGIGMSEDYLERIWQPFEQADSSISRRFGGTGLGLSITKTLVELLGGTISVNSRAGEGSTFYVDLSLAKTEQPMSTGMYDFSAINALIVDDDISTCDYIRLLLTRCGVRNVAVTSGPEAINAVETALREGEPYTVCLIDWRMPKMDGLETVKRIRSIVGETLPIIVITAYDFSEVADKAAEVGVNMFISKPLFQSSLFNLLANISGSPVHRNEEKLASYDFSGSRILLVEDNAMNMEIASKILEAAKFTVDSAWNGQEAVDMFLSSPAGKYKAILMDVQMPVMDGYHATQVIRASQHPEATSIPVIAMTADAFAENVAESRAAGMNGHISKPIDLPSLFKTLDEFIHLRLW